MNRFAKSFVLIAIGAVAASCGGGSSSPTPVPTPTPTPVAVATPTPAPTPDPACSLGLCEPPTDNKNPVVRLGLRLYQLFDANGNWILPTPTPHKQVVSDPIPVGFNLRFDITGKDEDDKPTEGKGNVEWVYSDEGMVEIQASSQFQRKIRALKPGHWEMYAVLDGVASNSLGFTFCDPKTDTTCHYP